MTSIKQFAKGALPRVPGYRVAVNALRHRARAPKWLDRLPVPHATGSVSMGPSGLVLTHPERCNIAKELYWNGGQLVSSADRVAISMFTAAARNSDVVIDIGSSSGLFSIIAAAVNPDAEILAFDILPEAFHILVDNLLANDIYRRVKPHLAGVGAEAEFRTPVSQTLSSMPRGLSLNFRSDWEDKQRASIPVVTLDSICLPSFSGKRVLIKIDAEEAEPDIFRFGQSTLQALAPDILCEVGAPPRRVEEYDAILSGAGYRKFLITSTGPEEREKVERIEPPFRDWYFTKKDRPDWSSTMGNPAATPAAY